MPVKWDESKDQFILMQLVADFDITPIHFNKIVDNWPSTFGEKPTVRAIKEHFVKLKSTLNKHGITTPTKTASKANTGTSKSVTPSPMKAKNKTSAGSQTKGVEISNANSRKKRKIVEDSEEDEAEVNLPDVETAALTDDPKIKTEIKNEEDVVLE